jgi:hypothetical protein
VIVRLRVALLAFVSAVSACGSRTQLRTPSVDAFADANDASDAPPSDVPITPACSWPPIADAVRLSDGSESWMLGGAVVGDSAIYVAWYPQPSGAVWVTRVGFGGERVADPWSAGGLFADDVGWLRVAAAGGDGMAAFTSWRGRRNFESLRPAMHRVDNLVEHNEWPEILSVVQRGNGFDALVTEPTRFETMTLDDVGNVTGRRLLAIPADASTDPTRAVASDGSFAALWTVADAAGRHALHARVFDATGRPAGEELTLARSGATSARAVAVVDGGFLAMWSTDGSDGEPAALHSAVIDFAGALRVAPATVATEGLVPDTVAGLAVTGAAHGAIASFAVDEGGSRRLVLLPASADGQATRPLVRLRSFARVTRIIALETRDGAALVFDAATQERDRLAVWSMGFTCLR